MSVPGLFTGERIRLLMSEVAEELEPAAQQAVVIIVGGSLLAWRGIRLATEDVDSSLHLDAALKAAVRRVAERHRLAADWFNDRSASWHPQTLRLEQCEVLLDHPQLRVLGAPLAAVFLMKLNRSQPQDVSDMIAMWPHVADVFPTARHVVDAYYDAFPVENHDEYLILQVVDVARRAGALLSPD